MNRCMYAALPAFVTALVVTFLALTMIRTQAPVIVSQSTATSLARPPAIAVESAPIRVYVVEIAETGVAALPGPRRSIPFCVVAGAGIQLIEVEMDQIRVVPPQSVAAVCYESAP